MNKPLLPPGCFDALPPSARQEREVLHALLRVFDAHGYEEVSPPLLEYSDTLLAGRGSELSTQILRVMDPSTPRVMGLRADQTLQIARIAATRLLDAPLPLRLSYAGNVVRARGEKDYGTRQLRQAGIELIGIRSPEADAEVMVVAARALMAVGAPAFTIDLNLPGLVSALLAEEAMEEAALAALMRAVTHKDTAAIQASGCTQAATLAALVATAGKAEAVLPALRALPLPAEVYDHITALEVVVNALRRALGDGVRITIDPAETRGLEYHTGITFSFFAAGAAQEIGRGGRYRIDRGENGSVEATGFTLYVNLLRRVLPAPVTLPRVFVADPEDRQAIAQLQQQGYAVVVALPEYGAGKEEAARLGCTHYWAEGKLVSL